MTLLIFLLSNETFMVMIEVIFDSLICVNTRRLLQRLFPFVHSEEEVSISEAYLLQEFLNECLAVVGFYAVWFQFLIFVTNDTFKKWFKKRFYRVVIVSKLVFVIFPTFTGLIHVILFKFLSHCDLLCRKLLLLFPSFYWETDVFLLKWSSNNVESIGIDISNILKLHRATVFIDVIHLKLISFLFESIFVFKTTLVKHISSLFFIKVESHFEKPVVKIEHSVTVWFQFLNFFEDFQLALRLVLTDNYAPMVKIKFSISEEDSSYNNFQAKLSPLSILFRFIVNKATLTANTCARTFKFGNFWRLTWFLTH